MPFELQADETLSKSIRRIAQEELDSAVENLTNPEDRNEGIHSARKSFKKLRAVARLVRTDIGDTAYRRDNALLRDTARMIASVRDSWVLVEALDKLQPDIHHATFGALRNQLVANHEEEIARVESENIIPAVIEQIGIARENIEQWKLKKDSFKMLRPNIERVYVRGQSGLANAQETPSPEVFHDWRKRVKYLWYHLRILTPIWTEMMTELNGQLDLLAEDLGEAHDYIVFRDAIQQYSDQYAIENVLEPTIKKQRKLEKRAIERGKFLYAEEPSAFVKRIETYWKLWR